MEIRRMITIDNPGYFLPGDKINVGHYTATCQEITNQGAIFLLDRYLDEPMQMYGEDTNQGGYEKSDLRKALQSDEVLQLFADIRDNMVPFKNGDLLRIPFAGEMFGDNLPSWIKPDGHEQWPLMKDSHNRAASRCGDPEWGWLANTVRDTSTLFCDVGSAGHVGDWGASSVIGVRPAFLIARESIVPVQNVFKSSILSNASGIMLLHNHPSGDISPSGPDFNITKRLVEAGKLMIGLHLKIFSTSSTKSSALISTLAPINLTINARHISRKKRMVSSNRGRGIAYFAILPTGEKSESGWKKPQKKQRNQTQRV